MHELSVAEGMMRIVVRTARENALGRIVAVRMKIGRLRGFDARQIALCFEMLSAGTLADGARLEIEAVSPHCHCRDCGRSWMAEGFRLDCPSCGGHEADIVGGHELHIENVVGEPRETESDSRPANAKSAPRGSSRGAPDGNGRTCDFAGAPQRPIDPYRTAI